jgi:putative tricarboxylic transport membrane protein
MTIIEGLTSGFFQAISFEVLPYLMVGSIFGLVIGIIPGLSGHFAMAMAVTFLYTMEPGAGIAFLLGAHATVAQGGGLTAILFSTPGTGQNAATLLDGPPMRDQGRGGVAVGAAMASCFLGATFGAIVLAALLPVLRQVVLFFGPPEVVMMAFLALTFVAVLGKEDIVRSLIAALIGLLMAMVGVDNVTNTERFTMGLLDLSDGLSLVPVILGLFAVAEMFDLWATGGSLARNAGKPLSARETQKQIFEGIGLAFKNWWLVIRCSAIGTSIGLVPGLGSAAAAFIAYGHAKQTSKSKETFGKGNVEGVIGPEAANDAVEGGALASTIAFGIPGSSSMAILLSGLFILGLETGPKMINQHVDIVFIMIFTIIFGNLIGTIVGMFIVNPLSRATSVRAEVMVPVLMAIIVTGAYATDRSMFDIGVAVMFGVIGYVMKILNYSRAAMLIGFVLGFSLEKNLYLALLLDGSLFWLDPIPLVLGVITVVFLAFNIWAIARDKRRAAA